MKMNVCTIQVTLCTHKSRPAVTLNYEAVTSPFYSRLFDGTHEWIVGICCFVSLTKQLSAALSTCAGDQISIINISA